MSHKFHPALARLCLPLVVALGGSACVTPSLTVASWQASPLLPPRGADRLVLVDGEGRSSAKRAVADFTVDEARGGFFRVDDRGDEGLKLVLAGAQARLEGTTRAPRAKDLFVRVDVLEWNQTPVKLLVDGEDGARLEVPGVHGQADLQVSVADATGALLVREREVRGVADLEVDPDAPPPPMDAAALVAGRAAVRLLLEEIGPRRVTEVLRLDDGDPGQKSILKDAGTGTLQVLERRLRRYLKREPDNAIARFNLAVTLDAQGRFDEALAAYDAALSRVPRAGFAEGRAGCAQRKARFEAMFGPLPSTPSTPSPTETSTPAPGAPPAPVGPSASGTASAPPAP
jgi:hypothetical protein